MRRRWRTVAKVAAVGALALLLTSCLKLDMRLELKSDNTVGGSIIFAVDKQVLDLTGASAEDILGSAAPLPSGAPGVTSKDYDDGKFVGKEYAFDAVPLDEFAGDPSDPDSLSIVREGDLFKVSGVLDLSQGVTGATGLSGVNVEDLFASAQISISITFPGEVKSSNGTVSGNTVTWTPKFGDRLELQATGSAVASGGSSSIVMWVLIGAGVILLLIIVFVLLSRRGKGGTPAAVGFEGAPAAAAGEAPAAPEAAAVMPTPAPEAITTPAPPTTPAPAPPSEAPTQPVAPPEAPSEPPAAVSPPAEAPTAPSAPEPPAPEAPEASEEPERSEGGGDVPPPPPPSGS
jgi:hypothetical protein